MAVTEVMMKASYCPHLQTKVQLYSTAAAMCRDYGLYQREAIIYCKLFHISFHKLNSPLLALEHAKRAVLADPDYGEVSWKHSTTSALKLLFPPLSLQGYNCQAQVFHCFGLALQHENSSEAKSSFSKAIDDYQKSYFLSGKYEQNSACQAVLIALDQGKVDRSSKSSNVTE